MVCCTMAAFAFHDRERISPICCGTGEEFESNVRASGKHGDSEPTSGNNGKFRKNTESYEAGHTEIFFLQMVVCESLLGRGRRFSANIVNKERSARTGRILQYPHPIRAVALKRLNCRVQNCARGSLRGRGLHPAYLIVHIKILPSEGTIF